MPRMPNFLACVGVLCTGEADFQRANGDCVCPTCKRSYYDHPYCQNSELAEQLRSSSFPEYILHVLCDGRHVKL